MASYSDMDTSPGSWIVYEQQVILKGSPPLVRAGLVLLYQTRDLNICLVPHNVRIIDQLVQQFWPVTNICIPLLVIDSL